jgi:predicted phage-related endonuclease
MPDVTKESVSASQAAMLFNQSPYGTRFMLWQHFKNGVPLGKPRKAMTWNDRLQWGLAQQPTILRATAEAYHLELVENVEERYERDGQLGCTIDGHLIAPDVGEIIVEAKNLDWLQWRDNWTESAAPPHIEIQMQQQLAVRKREQGIIACFVGGNDLKFYERRRAPEVEEQIREETAHFFESLAFDTPPEVIGEPIELPTIAALYPTANEAEVLTDMEDEELTEIIRQYDWAREQKTFHEKLAEQMKVKLLARAGTAGKVRARYVQAIISKSQVAASLCHPHTEAKETKRAFVQTRIKVLKMDDPPPPAPDQGITP